MLLSLSEKTDDYCCDRTLKIRGFQMVNKMGIDSGVLNVRNSGGL